MKTFTLDQLNKMDLSPCNGKRKQWGNGLEECRKINIERLNLIKTYKGGSYKEKEIRAEKAMIKKYGMYKLV